MAEEMTLSNLNLQPGVCMKTVGDIPLNAKHFRIELGKNYGNVGLHFNPRFNFHNDRKIIVCNSKTDYIWGREERQKHFKFKPGSTAEISIPFKLKQFKVKLPDGFAFTFPNRLNLQEINFLEITGDFKLTSLTFE